MLYATNFEARLPVQSKHNSKSQPSTEILAVASEHSNPHQPAKAPISSMEATLNCILCISKPY